jgi:hypothetical protein
MYQGCLSAIRSPEAPGVLIAEGGAPMVSMQYLDTGPGRGGPGASGSLVACPECELPAEIAERFWLNSTDGPVLHVCVICVDGHYFRMPADGLPADLASAQAPDTSRADQHGSASAGPHDYAEAASHAAAASLIGFVRMPGRLGTVGNPLPNAMRDEEATATLA